jgi:hypothetical protein
MTYNPIKKRSQFYSACFFISVIILSLSCGKKKRKIFSPIVKLETEIVHVRTDETNSKTPFHEFVQDIEFTALETTKNNQIANIAEVLYSKGKYYIWDDKYGTVTIFDKNGQYIKNIGAIGRAPGEFRNVIGIEFSADSNSIYILSSESQKVLEYNLNGEFIKDIRTRIWATDFGVLKQELFFYINKNENSITDNYNLIGTTPKGKVNGQYFPFQDKNDIAIGISGFLRKNRAGLLFNNSFSDTIFQITSDKIYAKYVFDFGKRNIPKSIIQSNQLISAKSEEYSFLRKAFFETNNGFLFDYQEGNHIRTMYMRSGINGNDYQKIELEYPLAKVIGRKEGNRLIASIKPIVLIQNVNADYSIRALKYYPGLKVFIDGIKFSDNPVLITYKLK